VVDDADAIRRLASRLLGKRGYTVLLAANAEEALEIFEQNVAIAVLLTSAENMRHRGHLLLQLGRHRIATVRAIDHLRIVVRGDMAAAGYTAQMHSLRRP